MSAQGKKQIALADIIAKRKARWKEKHDLDYDRQLICAAAELILSEESLRSEVTEKPYLLIEACFYIVDKKRDIVPFFLNVVQRDFIARLEEHGTRLPFLILKGRQQGFTSLITAIQLAFAIVRKNFSGATISHSSDSTNSIFNDKAKVVFDRLPDILKPHLKFNSKKEYFFDRLNSSWRVSTADNNIFRGATLNFAHFSEAAFYSCSLAEMEKGVGEALTADAFKVYESTANGFNEFKDKWDSGSCINLFYGWWLTDEYRSTEYRYIELADGWLTERVKVLEKLGLDREQIAWYCEKYNGYNDKSAIRQEYPCSAEEAFVASGECVFDMEKLTNRMTACARISPIKAGYFEYRKIFEDVRDADGFKVGEVKKLVDVKFIESASGFIRIHEEPQVKKSKSGDITHLAPYVLGGDTAGTGEDNFTAKVINCMTDRCAATLQKQRMDEDYYAEQCLCLARYYNEALVGIEINYSREPMRIIAQEYEYPNIYMREKLDRINDEVVKDIGFETTAKTRPIIIAELVRLFRDSPDIECDLPTLREMSVFVKKANGRQEALVGQHDDLVLALAIAHFIKGQQASDWIEAKVPENDFILKNFKVADSENYGYSGEGTDSFMSWDDL